MICKEFEAHLTAFSLGELPPRETEAARAHLATCSACASAALRDRQLTGLVRASAVPVPPGVQAQVLAALRREAVPLRRRRHLLTLSSAAGLAAAVAFAAVMLVPAPSRSTPLSAAWNAYRNEPRISWAAPTGRTSERLFAVLGHSARTPDLSRFGLHPVGWGARTLGGHLAAVAEYRDPDSRRVALIRWRGKLPGAAGSASSGDIVQSATWGTTSSMWWQSDGVVYCLIGTVDSSILDAVAKQLEAS